MYFLVLGNDNRMNYVAKQLYSLGCEIGRDINNIRNNCILVLSPPVNIENNNFITNYAEKFRCIYGGCIATDFYNLVDNKTDIIDYLSFTDVIIENAKLTARGIIKETLTALGRLKDLNAMIVGYGYCGKAIALELKKYKSNITIAVRNNKLKNEIEEDGFIFRNIKSLSNYPCKEYNCVFNTVPALILNKSVIDNLDSSVMIFDIASKPGGVDFAYCKNKGIFATLSLGIPGRAYPKEAGILIGNACYNHFINHYSNTP